VPVVLSVARYVNYLGHELLRHCLPRLSFRRCFGVEAPDSLGRRSRLARRLYGVHLKPFGVVSAFVVVHWMSRWGR
jgi:hypothetical protein